MKQLSMKAAQRCESATTPRCRCRCGGRLHGAARGMDEKFFENLPGEDPHKATVRAEKVPRERKKKVKPLPLFD